MNFFTIFITGYASYDISILKSFGHRYEHDSNINSTTVIITLETFCLFLFKIIIIIIIT
jgi:hypothetical protein